MNAALARAKGLLDGADGAAEHDGYLDLLGAEAPGPTGVAQRLMLTRAVPAIYERWWRPALGRIAKGPTGPGMADEHRLARLLLAVGSGDAVLDIACGPGNFTRELGRLTGSDGVAVGIDASPTMLRRAVAAEGESVAYVRGDAVRLPFRDASFDAVCCFAALHLFDDPWTALDHMARVLRPGGRIALLTSCSRGLALLPFAERAGGALSGMRVFGREELAHALRARGFAEVRQRVAGLVQIAGATLG